VRFFSILFLISCGGGSSDVNEPPPVGGEQGGANGPSADNIPIAGDGEIQARISGVVEVPDFNGQVIQFDALAEFEGQSVVVANERYDAPGEFRLVVRGEHESVDVIVYLDVDGDGPSQGDLRYEYPGNPISLNPEAGEVVEIGGLELSVVDTGEGNSGGDVEGATPLVDGEGSAPPVPEAGQPGPGPNDGGNEEAVVEEE